eukprot:7376524-Prymnesium_polylepis.4
MQADRKPLQRPDRVAHPGRAHRRIRHLQGLADGAGPHRRDALDGHARLEVGEGGGRALLHDARAVRRGQRAALRSTQQTRTCAEPRKRRGAPPHCRVRSPHQHDCADAPTHTLFGRRKMGRGSICYGGPYQRRRRWAPPSLDFGRLLLF